MAEHKSKTDGPKPNGSKSGDGARGTLTRSQSRLPSSFYMGPLGRLRSEFDRLFDEFFHGWPTSMAEAGRESGLGIEVHDRDDAVVIRADAPGYEPGDFDIEMRGENLVLNATQSDESTREGQHQWKRRELYHSIPLPAEIDAEKIDAQYRNGVLIITAAKREPTKHRKIEVKT